MPSVLSLWRCGAIALSIVAVLGVAGCEKEQPETGEASPRISLTDGARVVWLGDSITHEGRFTQYLEALFLTRHPGWDLEFFNRGLAGDTAGGVLERFDAEVAALEPSHVFVQLGMNDGGYRRYRPEIGEVFERDLGAVLDRIAESGAQAVVISPTVYDVEAEWRDRLRDGEPVGYDDPALLGYDAVMADFAGVAQRLAMARGLPFVDVRQPLVAAQQEGREKDPSYSVAPDSIHPSPESHARMALAIVDQALDLSPSVSEVTVEMGEAPRTSASRGEVGEVEISDADPASWQFSFVHRAAHLPWRVPADAEAGFDAAGGRGFSVERLRIVGLENGRYVLQIDDFVCGTFSADGLAFGIDLTSIEASPQAFQAREVAELVRQRSEGPLRSRQDWMVDRKHRLAAIEVAETPTDRDDLEEAYKEWKLTFDQAVGDLETQAADLWQQAKTAAQLVDRRFQLHRLSLERDAPPKKQ